MPISSDLERLGAAVWWAIHHPFAASSRAALKVTRTRNRYEAERVVRRDREDSEPIVIVGHGFTPAMAIEAVNLKLDQYHMADTGEDQVDFPGRNRDWVPGAGSQQGGGRPSHPEDRREVAGPVSSEGTGQTLHGG